MGRVEEYRRQAEEAERKANQAPGPLERQAYEKIARSWRELEEEVRRAEKRGR
jgi:hypothetical protein